MGAAAGSGALVIMVARSEEEGPSRHDHELGVPVEVDHRGGVAEVVAGEPIVLGALGEWVVETHGGVPRL
jgi:hypothetical protein